MRNECLTEMGYIFRKMNARLKVQKIYNSFEYDIKMIMWHK